MIPAESEIRAKGKTRRDQKREADGSHVCLQLFLLTSITIFSTTEVEDKLYENSSLVANLCLPVKWTFAQHYFQLLFLLLKTLHFVCCSNVKAQEYAGFSFKPSGM